MPLEKKLLVALIVLTAVGMLVAWNIAAHPSRAAIGVMALGGVGYFAVTRIAHSRYASVLRTVAARTGLTYLATPGDEKASEVLARLRQRAESDVFRWKVDGKLPALAGEVDGFPVSVRVPVGLDFDAGAPDSTRIAVYHSVKFSGMTIYERSRLKKTPEGRQVTTGDPAFDQRYLVLAHRPEEAHGILTPEIRSVLLNSAGTGFRGIEVNRYGIFLHEEGKVADADQVTHRLRMTLKVAEAARAYSSTTAA